MQFAKQCGLKRARTNEPWKLCSFISKTAAAGLEISTRQQKNVNSKVAANRVRVFVALRRRLHGGCTGAAGHTSYWVTTQKFCIWIISSAQRGFSLPPPS